MRRARHERVETAADRVLSEPAAGRTICPDGAVDFRISSAPFCPRPGSGPMGWFVESTVWTAVTMGMCQRARGRGRMVCVGRPGRKESRG
jgi:hypothetical protein